ncbi:hypothetical protein CR513_00319, partial [Mucuna pruriens]
MEQWMKFQQNMNATMHNLKMQIRKLANSVSQLQSARSRNLPSQPILNPKGGSVSTVTLRSGKELQLTPEYNNMLRQTHYLFLLEPSQPRNLKLMRMEINISLLDAIKQIPKYVKFLKELCVHKRNKLKEGAEVGGVLSAHSWNKTSYPKKMQRSLSFLNPCTIGDYTFVDAMLDLGASINVMPASVYKSLNFGVLEPTCVVIQLANRSVVQPVDICEDVLIQVNDLIFPIDFYVLEMEDETSGKRSTLILGRPFLMMARTKIDIHLGTLSMEFGDNLDSTKDHSLYSMDVIDELVEEYNQFDSGNNDMTILCGKEDKPEYSISASIRVTKITRPTVSKGATNAGVYATSQSQDLRKVNIDPISSRPTTIESQYRSGLSNVDPISSRPITANGRHQLGLSNADSIPSRPTTVKSRLQLNHSRPEANRS